MSCPLNILTNQLVDILKQVLNLISFQIPANKMQHEGSQMLWWSYERDRFKARSFQWTSLVMMVLISSPSMLYPKCPQRKAASNLSSLKVICSAGRHVTLIITEYATSQSRLVSRILGAPSVASRLVLNNSSRFSCHCWSRFELELKCVLIYLQLSIIIC